MPKEKVPEQNDAIIRRMTLDVLSRLRVSKCSLLPNLITTILILRLTIAHCHHCFFLLPFFLSFFPNLCKVKEDADGREGAKLTSRDISEADIKVRILQKFEADESHAASNIAGMAMGLAMIFRFSGPLPCAT